MIKVVMPSSFNFDRQIASLVDVHSRGVDSSWLKKSAAVLTKELSEIRPDPNFTYVHLIALGDLEKTGANRNGDMFPAEVNEKRHFTFVKNANWYHNHRNKPSRGDKIYGHVKASAYNKPMGRVELIVAIDNKKDPESIEKLARGEDLPVSMACKESHDVCSVCGHKAKTEAEHCRHIKEACTQLTDDGRTIGMINPIDADITFFDISKVHRNADRIAFSLRKVASASPVVLSTELARMYGITEVTNLVKDAKYKALYAQLEKCARLEKQIEGEIKANPVMQTIADGLANSVGEDLGIVPEDKVQAALGKLASDCVSLPIQDFYKMVMGPRFSEIENDIPAAQACLPTVFSNAIKCAEEFLNGVSNYEPVDSALPSLVKNKLTKVGNSSSLKGSAVNGKIVTGTLRKSASLFVPNKSLLVTSEIGSILATEYARYKVAMLNKVGDPVVERMSILQDFGN